MPTEMAQGKKRGRRSGGRGRTRARRSERGRVVWNEPRGRNEGKPEREGRGQHAKGRKAEGMSNVARHGNGNSNPDEQQSWRCWKEKIIIKIIVRTTHDYKTRTA